MAGFSTGGANLLRGTGSGGIWLQRWLGRILVGWWWRRGVPHEVFMQHWISRRRRLLDREPEPFDFGGVESWSVVVVDHDDGGLGVSEILGVLESGGVGCQIDDAVGDAGIWSSSLAGW